MEFDLHVTLKSTPINATNVSKIIHFLHVRTGTMSQINNFVWKIYKTKVSSHLQNGGSI